MTIISRPKIEQGKKKRGFSIAHAGPTMPSCLVHPYRNKVKICNAAIARTPGEGRERAQNRVLISGNLKL